jgi:hypothetical protein
MSEDIDLKNPFAAFNASLMDDEDIIKYWIKPQILFGMQAIGIDLTGDTPVVLEGGRGTGKTMLLKWMSNEIKIKEFVAQRGNGEGFLEETSYLGVYHRFDGPSLGSFTGRNTSEEAWETIFKHYLELLIGQKLIMLLLNLKKNNCLKLEPNREKELALKILQLTDPNFVQIPDFYSLKSVNAYFQQKIDEVFDFVNCSALFEGLKFSSYILRSGRLIFELPVLIQEIVPELRKKRLILLLDEYENLRLNQQKIVNTLVKHVKTPVTFRIGTRLRGFKTFDTLNEKEFLMEDADYRRIIFEDVLMAKKGSYRNLLRKIAQKRLEQIPEFKQRHITDIKGILGEFSPEEEATVIVFDKALTATELEKYPIEKYLSETKHTKEIRRLLQHKYGRQWKKFLLDLVDKKPLLEMLNLLLLRRGYKPFNIANLFRAYLSQNKDSVEYLKYTNLYEKNRLDLVFQLASLNRPKQKQYAGFSVFCQLSSGIIRNFLELCYQSFNIAWFSDRDSLMTEGKLPLLTQSIGAKIRAERFMEVIERIPEYGNEIKSLVISLGAIFYSWQQDPLLSEPEVTYFCIDRTALSLRARRILDSAVQWSVLQPKKPMKGKAVTEPLLDVYALNHILAPYFGISYRLRGRIQQFSRNNFEALLFGNEEEKKMAINKLSRLRGTELHRTKPITEYLGKE